MRMLFVCSRNLLRSPTAQNVFSVYEGVEALSAGTDKSAETPLSGDLVEWADVILVMESEQRRKLTERFSAGLRYKRVITLDIPDRFEYMQPELVEILKRKVAALFPELGKLRSG